MSYPNFNPHFQAPRDDRVEVRLPASPPSFFCRTERPCTLTGSFRQLAMKLRLMPAATALRRRTCKRLCSMPIELAEAGHAVPACSRSQRGSDRWRQSNVHDRWHSGHKCFVSAPVRLLVGAHHQRGVSDAGGLPGAFAGRPDNCCRSHAFANRSSISRVVLERPTTALISW